MNNELPEKLPPRAVEAEKCLLGCLMLDKEAIVKVADFLNPQDFYQGTHQQIYQVMSDLFDKQEPIDLLSVTTRLKEKNQLENVGGASYLSECINSVPTASNVLNYAKIVRKKKILRDLIQASQEVGSLAYNEAEDVNVLLDKAESKIFSIAQRSLTQEFLPVGKGLEEAWERIEELSHRRGKMRGLSTGFRALDNILAGLQKSDLLILASRPALGKSSLALNFASHITTTEKVPVGFFSLEMSKDQLVDRLIAAQANVDLWRLRTGRLSGEGEDNDFVRIRRALDVLAEAPIYIDDAAGSNILQIRAMARRLQAQKGLGLVIVDYLQLMEPRNPGASMVQQVTEISKSLKGLAKELNVPVLALSQLSRAVEQRTRHIPRLADLRESGCLAGDTLITRADTGERISIKELVGQKEIPVHSLDKDWKLKEKKISKVFCSGKKKVYELKTRSGFKIKASANHPFLKIDGWKRLNQLSKGDYIATPRSLSLSKPKNSLSKEEIILLAHLLGDGKDHPITNWYRELGIKPVHSYKKEIPQAIFSLNKESLALFLKHLCASDESLTPKYLKGRKPGTSIYYSTTSPKMAEGIKHLLLRFGVRSKIGKAKKSGHRICYQVLIQGKKNQLRFLTQIGSYGKGGEIVPQLTNYLQDIKTNPNLDITPKEAWSLFVNKEREEKGTSQRAFSAGIQRRYCGTSLFKAGIGSKVMERIATFLESARLFQLAQSDVFWDQIVSIKPLGIEKVYDATVLSTHNFVANDIIVHNSLEQDADVVLFIHREDRYNPNTARKNIADIIIAKHRNGPVGRVELYFDGRTVSFRDLEKRIEE